MAKKSDDQAKQPLKMITIKNTHKNGRPILGRDGVIPFGKTVTVRKCDVSEALIKAGHISVVQPAAE